MKPGVFSGWFSQIYQTEELKEEFKTDNITYFGIKL